MSKKKVLLRGVFINRDTNGEGVLKVGTTLIRVSTVMGILYQSVVREALDEILPQKAAVTCGSTQKMISINDVIYFESLNRHIIFHFANTSTLEIKDSMENMISVFSYPSFVQIHRSYCINLNYVDSFTPLAVTMTDGCKIPLSRKKQTIFQERFNNLIRGTIK